MGRYSKQYILGLGLCLVTGCGIESMDSVAYEDGDENTELVAFQGQSANPLTTTLEGEVPDVDGVSVSGNLFDLNGDGVVNVVDAIQLVQAILGSPSPDGYDCEGHYYADMNFDGLVNVVDAILMVSCVLGTNCPNSDYEPICGCSAGELPNTCGGCTVEPTGNISGTVDTDLIVNGLDDPLLVTAPAGDLDRIFIVEQDGVISIHHIGSSTTAALTTFLDISGAVHSGGERGLLGMAFDPDYWNNGYFYVNYTYPWGGNTRIARYTVSSDPNVADPNSEVVLLEMNQPYSNHNGGGLEFGGDGMLYIGTGDGGSGGDPQGNGQDLTTLLGKMLRLDPHSESTDYIPEDNPFVGVAGDDEIWAYGLRNPWRFSFDSTTGDLYIGDVGQNAWEEINFQPSDSAGGENYGWKCYEGNHTYSSSSCSGISSVVMPVHEYAHNAGLSVTGGVVYRGCAYPELFGKYFYADYYQNGDLRSFSMNNGDAVNHQNWNNVFSGASASLGQDGQGEVYVVDHSGGRVFHLTHTP